MLNRRTAPGEEQRNEDHPIARRQAESNERKAGHQRSKCKQVAFAEAFRDQCCGNLAGCHRDAVRRTDQPDLRERQAERLREQRQKDVGDVGQSVVQSMRSAA